MIKAKKSQIRKISASSYSTYQSCPRLYKFRYIDKLPPEEKNEAAILGIALHAVITDMYRFLKFDRQWLISNWKRYFLKTAAEEKIKFASEKNKKYWLSQGYPILNVFFKVAQQKKLLRKPIAAERGFRVKYKDFYLTGRIDLVIQSGENIFIIDFKSSRSEKTKDELKKDHQLTFYSWGFRKSMNMKERKVALFYLRSGNIVSSERCRDDYIKLARKLIRVMKKIDNKEFEPPKNLDCRYCDHKKKCAELKLLRKGKK